MRILILTQEEPVFIGPMLIRFSKIRNKEICGVLLLGKRDGGNNPKGIFQKLERIYIYYLIYGLNGILSALIRKIVINSENSIYKACKKYNILCNNISAINEASDYLKKLSPDIIINQSDIIIPKDIIDFPKHGVISRHGSLLPDYRGRMASFWSFFHEKSTGITIYRISEKIDSGVIILQKNVDSKDFSDYFEYSNFIFNKSAGCLDEAIKLIGSGNIEAEKINTSTPLYKFPTKVDAILYRKALKKRNRQSKK